jgi:hypothetical protein
MVRYPDVYRKAREEIDRVIGNERLPDLTDRHSLPYIETLVMELYGYVISDICMILPSSKLNVGGTLLSP